MIAAARLPLRSGPAKSHFLRPSAISLHTARIGQEVEVRYRWHPLYRRRVTVLNVELRGGRRVVHYMRATVTLRSLQDECWMHRVRHADSR